MTALGEKAVPRAEEFCYIRHCSSFAVDFASPPCSIFRSLLYTESRGEVK